jgi:hypothetical protein
MQPRAEIKEEEILNFAPVILPAHQKKNEKILAQAHDPSIQQSTVSTKRTDRDLET